MAGLTRMKETISMQGQPGYTPTTWRSLHTRKRTPPANLLRQAKLGGFDTTCLVTHKGCSRLSGPSLGKRRRSYGNSTNAQRHARRDTTLWRPRVSLAYPLRPIGHRTPSRITTGTCPHHSRMCQHRHLRAMLTASMCNRRSTGNPLTCLCMRNMGRAP